MSVLADISIMDAVHFEHIKIAPYSIDRIQPASYDVALSKKIRIFRRRFYNHQVIDTRDIDPGLTEIQEIPEEGFKLNPSVFILGATEEWFELGDSLVARVEGKSSLGRLGLVIHATAGWIDPGFRGNITLELTNNTQFPIVLYPGMLIGQIAFMHTDKPVKSPYGSDGLNSKYQDSKGVIESRYK